MTETSARMHDGTVVSVLGDVLTTTCTEGKQHSYTMAKDAKVTCDGQASKAADLKAGTHVRVTTCKDDKTVATAIEFGKHIPAMSHKESEGTLRCRVVAYNFSPKGAVDGLLVEAGGQPTQIVFPYDKGTELARCIVLGETVDLEVEAEPAPAKGEVSHSVYRFVSLTPSQKSDGAAASSPRSSAGVVVRLNYERHGEVNGVVLDTGDFIHLKPDGMRQVGLKVGDRIEADGETHPMDLGGRVVEATTVNGVRLTSRY